MSSTKKAVLFYSLTLAQSVAFALWLTPLIGGFALAVVMFTPLVSVLIMKLIVTREGWHRRGWSDLGAQSLGLAQWPIAIGLPFVVLLFAYGVVWLLGIAQVDLSRLAALGGPDMIANVVVTMLFCFGEEIGWRGYLVPKLLPLGHRAALLLAGLMQAVWHVPFIAFTSFYHGDGNVWIVLPLLLGTMTIAGILFGYLRLASGSVWPAVIAHALFNVYWTGFNVATIAKSPLAYEYLAGESGVLTLLIVAVFASVLVRRLERNPKSAEGFAPMAVPTS